MVEFGLSLVSEAGCEAAVRQAVGAEKAGFDYLFVSDHTKGGNVYVCLASIACKTERILLGPGVTNPYLIHPVVSAQMLSSLGELAPRRVVCGIGAGDMGSLRRLGVGQVRPIRAVREAVYIIRALVSGQSVDLQGEVFKISGVKLGCESRSVPLFIGAQGAGMLRLSGEVGDGVLVNSSDPEECRRAVEVVKRGVKEAGRDIGSVRLAAFTPLSVAVKLEEALKPILPKVAVVAAGCREAAVKRLGISVEEWMRVRRAVVKGERGGMVEAVTPRMIEAFSICGTPEASLERVEALIRAGLELIVFSAPYGPDEGWALDWMSREVLPRFRSL